MTSQEIRELWKELTLGRDNGRLEVSPNMLGLMNGLLSQALESRKREARVEFLRWLTGLPITSSKQLPYPWVATIIDQLIGDGLPYSLSERGRQEIAAMWFEFQISRGQLELPL